MRNLWTMALGAALAIAAAPQGGFAATDDKAMSLCQIEIDEADLPKPTSRPETVGFMKRIEGQVNILRLNRRGDVEEVEGEVGMDLFAQDAVVTGPDGGFDAIFTDSTTVSGVADTCIEISNYLFKPEADQGEFRMRLGRGVVSVAAGDIAKIKGDTMSVKVRNDTNLAVTGTVLVVRAK